MPSLADVIRRHGPDYLARFGRAVLPSHARALRDISNCRTPALGGHLVECDVCGTQHVQHHSCRNRACAQCGADRTESWLQRQRELLLPVPYFHVVFTVPSELRFIIRSHQKALLSVLARAAFESLSDLCGDEKHLGGRIGALAVIHTWTRAIEWHPHAHLLVPGGALDSRGRWITVSRRKKHFLVPVRALADRFRGVFLRLARKALPDVRLPYLPKKKRWVVYCKETVQGKERVLEYLGRYIHKTALSNSSILACTDDAVTFRYRDSRDNKEKTMTLPPHEFLRRFLQHVLPRGFHRVRSFGLLHASQRVTLRRLQLMLERPAEARSKPRDTKRQLRRCAVCKVGTLRRLGRFSAADCLQFEFRCSSTPPIARAPPS
jgi:hypothetical protein